MKKIRVICLATIGSQLFLTLPARILGMRVLWIHYHARRNSLRWSPLRPILLLFARLATIIVATEQTQQMLIALRFPPHRLIIIPPGLGDAEGWQTNIFGSLAAVKQPQFRKGALVVGVIASLTRDHGIEYLLQAIRLCRDVIPTIQCIIVGHGPERQQLQWLTERLDLKRNVLLVGWNEESQKWLSHFDIVVDPAIVEAPFDYTMLEAMWEGIPILAVATSGSIDAIEQSKTGVRVEPRNPVMLAEAIANLYHHADWRKEMGERARKRVQEHFSLDHMIDEFEKILTA